MSADVKVAEEVAQFAGVAEDWTLFQLGLSTAADVSTLLDLTSGRNYLTMGFILPFFEQLLETYGTDMIYFTGDTGVPFYSHRPEKTPKSLDDLAAGITRRFDLSRLAQTAQLLGVRTEEIIRSFADAVNAYPEDDIADKYVHYWLAERCMVWHYDGMDRNRAFFWMAAPPLALPLFHYVTNCSDRQRGKFTMYKGLLDQFSPDYLKFNYAQYNGPLGSFRFHMTLLTWQWYQKLPVRIRRLIRRLLGRKVPTYPGDSNLVRCIQRQVDGCSAIGRYLDLSDVAEISAGRPKTEMQLLLTVTSTIEKFELNRSSIDEFKDEILL